MVSGEKHPMQTNVLILQLQRRPDGMDHNVMPVWKQGISGKDVVVSILDDG